MSDLFEVENILKKRMYRNQVQFKIKWVGHSKKHSTWEPLANLNCPEILRDYEIGHAHDIVDAQQFENRIRYLVNWKSGTPSTFMESSRVKHDLPHLLFNFFEKIVEWCEPNKNLGLVDPSIQVNGEPVNISYVTNSSIDELTYLVCYGNGASELLKSTDIKARGLQQLANEFYEHNLRFN